MKQLLAALSSESLKLKRTLALWMVFIAPFIVILLQFFILFDRAKFFAGRDVWEVLMYGVTSIWAIFMLPLFITLETALLSGLEHSGQSWKHLFAQPIPRWSVYVAKLLTVMGMILVSTLVLVLGEIGAGKLLSVLRPELRFHESPNLTMMARMATMVYLASWILLAFHTWVSMRWKSFALAAGVGVAGTFFAVFASGARIGKFYPWLFPVNAVSTSPERMKLAILLGIIGGAIIAVAGCWNVVRRDVE